MDTQDAHCEEDKIFAKVARILFFIMKDNFIHDAFRYFYIKRKSRVI